MSRPTVGGLPRTIGRRNSGKVVRASADYQALLLTIDRDRQTKESMPHIDTLFLSASEQNDRFPASRVENPPSRTQGRSKGCCLLVGHLIYYLIYAALSFAFAPALRPNMVKGLQESVPSSHVGTLPYSAITGVRLGWAR